MYNLHAKKRFSKIDQENVAAAIAEWRRESPADKFFFRPYAEIDDTALNEDLESVADKQRESCDLRVLSNLSRQKLLVVHQTVFQQHLLRRYGNTACFLDATYKTTKYVLPLFFLAVKTNVDYQVVASFVVQDERKTSIQEALAIVKEWKPTTFMTDFDEQEIGAIEETFQGCKVIICDFHREQAWDRWLSKSTNNVRPHKEAILAHLRKFAKAESIEEFEMAEETLKASEFWNANYDSKLREWFENTWLEEKERWVWAF
eukprot:Seg3784.2 transcript_id=Seg3784.2/GoldUCD/mRNA.D3Y31 product="hypothetical protein" protein_id=Seg3784.2/GoldUCD/D3Y31